MRNETWCIAAVLLALVSGCGSESTTPPQEFAQKQLESSAEPVAKASLSYTVFADESEDTPIHSLVRLHIVVKGALSRESLTSLLKTIYDEKKKGPFTYHPNDPDLLIFAYSDEKHAEAMNGDWVAMLDSGDGKAEPTITVADKLLESLSEKPEKRFGLTEEQRQKLMFEVGECQDSADAAAQRRYPDDLDKQSEVSNQADLACILKVRRRYHVSENSYYKIAAEAIKKKWPSPPTPNNGG